MEQKGKLSKKLAQSVIEYAFMFGIIAAALVVMQYYINHSVQGRLKQIQDELNEPVVDENGQPFYRN